MDSLCLKSPLGDLTVFEVEGQIVALDWGHGLDTPRKTDNPVLNRVAAALQLYFKSGKESFRTLPLDPGGTEHQRAVWKAMQAIEAGETKTYGAIAKEINSSSQAVGMACGANPMPILIPCHRVVAQNGLGGYSADGGVETKATLLRLEGARL
ncbi:methylated-DNA--[protein]-cysteine S-methyltransferase [Magnetovibrio sp. PR-2]|uniref:methylated-DNA--[protein]-cysteine S-methyltransferase n=1 Tax=Magnetovibrio sp. PR-2 TaxID=3120356 RepID=UPI002FCE26A2